MKLLFLVTTLLAAQTPDWQPLFDGKTTQGWRTLAKDSFPSRSWMIEDGCLRSIAKTPRADLSTATSFRNFEWEFEWKISPAVNSGVKYLVFGIRPTTADGKFDPDIPKALGFELQLADDNLVEDAHVSPTRGTGALYSFIAPHDVPKLTVGQWHRARVLVDATHVEHWLDGVKVLDVKWGSPALRAAMAAQTRADLPKPADIDAILKDPKRAYPLVLTHHDGDAWYRNLKIRQLP